MNRRELFQLGVLSLMAFASRPLQAREFFESHTGNFHAIYSDPNLKKEFLLFLTNVYHLYPENKFHDLISQTRRAWEEDSDESRM